MNENIPIISVTGTKGKTTTVAVISDVLLYLKKNVLKVDTTGHFINGERKSTLDDSKAIWQLVPTVCPGRYLWEFYANPEICDNRVAVLECALGSSSLPGLGYRTHDVGVFLDVFEDHIGSSERIKSKADIVKAKSFIFSRLKIENPYAVFNADDEYVVSALGVIPKIAENVQLIPFGITFDKFNLDNHLKSGGVAITINDNKEIILKSAVGDKIIANLKVIPWTFNGEFMPSVFNIMASVGALYGYFEGKLPDNINDAIESVRLDCYGGRLTLLKANNGVKIIADYAHEKVSLLQIAKLAHGQVKKGGQVIGVVRLAHDRSDDLIIDTGKTIAMGYDELVVYDKIDGYFRKAKNRVRRFREVEGRTSRILSEAIASVNPNVTRILREDEAIKYANKIAKDGDVVVVIVNDDIRRSIGFIKDAFEAEFL